MKRKLTLIGVVTGLAVFSLFSVAAARAGGFGGLGGGSSDQIDRIAEILGISSEDLSNAIAQARSEEMTARLEERLATAVTNGVLTQDEADAIQEWYTGKPEALDNLTHSQKHGLRSAQQNDTLVTFLAGLVTDGIITQAESDEIATWIGARPTDALEKFKPQFGRGGHGPGFGGPRGGMFGHGRGHGGFGGFGQFGPGFPGPDSDDAVPATPSTDGTGTNTSIAYY